jgi:hypothetical protein
LGGELSLHRVWIRDRDRCQAAGMPDEVAFVTEPQLGIRMLAARTPRGAHRLVTADETSHASTCQAAARPLAATANVSRSGYPLVPLLCLAGVREVLTYNFRSMCRRRKPHTEGPW